MDDLYGNLENAETIGDVLNQIKDIKLDELDSTAGAAASLGFGGGWLSGFGYATQMWWSWVICIITLVASWFIFQKAGKPGWAAIIPIYNVWVTLEIIGKPWWWILLLLIPIVNIVVGIVMCYHLAKVFGQGVAFTVGLVLLPFIFMPMLAWGNYKYEKPKA